jgi:DUF4097 and DUF4098 domain-containing protein YvlB
MKTILFILSVALAVGTAAAQQLAVDPASGQQRIDRKRPARADGSVEIQNANGSVRVIGWDQNEVAIAGTLGRGAGLDFSGDSLRTYIRVVLSETMKDVGNSSLEVRVPGNSRTVVGTFSAHIEVSKVTGGVVLISASGDIRVSDNPHSVAVTSVSGDVDLSVSSSRVHARTVGGGITLQGTQEDVALSTVNGKIQVRGGQIRWGRFSTINGKIEFEGDLKPDGVLQCDTVNGNVDLLLPASVQADFQVSATGIQNEFGPQAYLWSGGNDPFGPGREAQGDPFNRVQREGHRPPTKRLTFSTGGGGASVTASSFNGTVCLRKKT